MYKNRNPKKFLLCLCKIWKKRLMKLYLKSTVTSATHFVKKLIKSVIKLLFKAIEWMIKAIINQSNHSLLTNLQCKIYKCKQQSNNQNIKSISSMRTINLLTSWKQLCLLTDRNYSVAENCKLTSLSPQMQFKKRQRNDPQMQFQECQRKRQSLTLRIFFTSRSHIW